MIIVTGATGELNGATVDHLLRHVSAADITVISRDPTKASRFKDLGITVRQADYAEPASLPAAFEGADQLLLVSSNDPSADAVSLHKSAIDAAVQAKVGRILYTSHQGASQNTPFHPGRDHAATEKLLSESGVKWTSLRNGFYMHSLNWLLGNWRETNAVTVPLDGPVSWTARSDAAEAAALILATGGKYNGITTITATAAPTFRDIAAFLTELTGKQIDCEVLGEEEWIAAQIAAGQKEFMAKFMLGMYQAANQRFFEGTDPLLSKLLGRDPITVKDFLADNV
jgi:NAD(P)H dehydrogenase (quinone)